MKAVFNISLNDTQLREFIDSLSITDCRVMINLLNKRIEREKGRRLINKVKKKAFQGNFLDTPITEFDLAPRTLSQLKKIEIKTVRDLTEIGLDGLMQLRNFGERTINEIKRIVFEREVDYL